MKYKDDIQVESFIVLFNKCLFIPIMGKTQFKYLRYSNKQNVKIPAFIELLS